MLTLFLALALAGDAAPEVEAAESLNDSDPALARAVLDHLAAREIEGAAEARDRAPKPLAWAPTAKLFGWQTLAGAWMGGPAIALSTRRQLHPNLSTGGMALGAAIGGGSALFYAKVGQLDEAKVGTIITAQQLGAWHGVVASVLIDDTRFEPATGGSIGLGLGAIGGYLAAEFATLDGHAVAGAWHGSLWGTGIGYLGLSMFSGAVDGHWRTQWTTMLLATDLGAVGGYALSSLVGLDRVDLFAADVGIGAGVLVALLVFAANDSRDWNGSTAPLLMLLTGSAGGVGAVVIERQIRSGESLPPLARGLQIAPQVMPTRDGVRAQVRGSVSF